MISSFSTYLQESFSGVLTNGLFIGIILALIASDLRSSKYFRWHKKFKDPYVKFIMFLLPYVVIIPIALILLMVVIFFLWLISLTGV
jgi:succinate dehydrogenase hydrophobic anchor subunit